MFETYFEKELRSWNYFERDGLRFILELLPDAQVTRKRNLLAKMQVLHRLWFLTSGILLKIIEFSGTFLSFDKSSAIFALIAWASELF